MADRAISFSDPMILAIIAGRKTMTRRIIKPQPEHCEHMDGSGLCEVGLLQIEGERRPQITLGGVVTKQAINYAVGDRLWVSERICASGAFVQYAADHHTTELIWPDHWKNAWLLPRSMPREFSRLTLIVEEVKVERLQEICEEDAIAEGLLRNPHGNGDRWCEYPLGSSATGWLDPRRSFQSFWKVLHGADSWLLNPWAIAIRFRAIRANIDHLMKGDA